MAEVLQATWTILRSNFSDFALISIGSFLVLLTTWIVFNLKYTLFIHYDLFSKYRLQKVGPSKEMVWQHFWSSFKEQFIIVLPLFLIGYVVLRFFGIHADPQLPTWKQVAFQFIVFNILEDTLFYWIHRLLHVPKLYKTVHYLHHKFETPFSVVGGIAHPAEVLFNFTLPLISGPLICGWFQGVHVTVFWAWLCFREIRSTEAHSGYHLPWHLSRVLWLVGYMGSPMHDVHHRREGIKYNFGSYIFWDYICGTYKSIQQLEETTAKAK